MRHLVIDGASYAEILVLPDSVDLTQLEKVGVDVDEVSASDNASSDNPIFHDRRLIFHCSPIGKDIPWTRSKLAEAINGKVVKFTTSDMLDTYWIGKGEVSPFLDGRGGSTFAISADIEPYKYEVEEAVIHAVASEGEGTFVTLNNLHKHAIPTVRSNGDAELVVGTTRHTLSKDSSTIEGFTLESGANVVQLVGDRTFVEFKWKRASCSSAN